MGVGLGGKLIVVNEEYMWDNVELSVLNRSAPAIHDLDNPLNEVVSYSRLLRERKQRSTLGAMWNYVSTPRYERESILEQDPGEEVYRPLPIAITAAKNVDNLTFNIVSNALRLDWQEVADRDDGYYRNAIRSGDQASLLIGIFSLRGVLSPGAYTASPRFALAGGGGVESIPGSLAGTLGAKDAWAVLMTGKAVFGDDSYASNGRDPVVGSENAYSVAYRMKMRRPQVPSGRRDAHFKAANEALFADMDANPSFAESIKKMIPSIDDFRGTGKLPDEWVWNHNAAEEGVMELVPSVQHWSPNPLWSMFHPLHNGKNVGGFKLWGDRF